MLIPFLLFDFLGVLLWAGTFLGLGYLFSNQLEKIAGYAGKLGILLVVILLISPRFAESPEVLLFR